jgi:hypothetical protein
MRTRINLSAMLLLGAVLAAPAFAASQEPEAPRQPAFRNKIEAEGTLSIKEDCHILTTKEGTRYALAGDLSAFRDGDHLFVRGPVGEKSACLEDGVTISVVDARADRGEPGGGSGTHDAHHGHHEEATVSHVEVHGKAVEKPGKTVVVRGVLTAEGVECQALRSDDNTLYTLAGKTEGFKVGDRVKVTGKVAEVSTCQQGITLDVQNITRIEKEKKK